ncbi:MAG: L-type lectin-domain containing protein [Candidatus Acidiferrum sp.]
MKTLHTPARIFTLALLVVLAGATLTHAQAQFSYTDFSSTAGLQLNGSAATFASAGKPTVLRLTPASFLQDGSAYYATPLSLSSAFTTQFTFQFTQVSPNGVGSADGISFIIQNSPATDAALGFLGGGIGYGGDDLNLFPNKGISNSLAIEIDTYRNAWDPATPHIAAMSCLTGYNSSHHGGKCANGTKAGSDPTIAINTALSTNVLDGQPHKLIVKYQPPCTGCQNLTVQLDGQPVLAVSFDLATLGLDANDDAYIGFTAATGGGFENQDILSWSFTAQTIVAPVSSTAPTTFSFANTLSHTVDFSQAAGNNNLTYPNNDPATIQIQSTNTIVDPATWPQYVTGGPLATSLLFPLVNDNPGGVGSNGSLFVDLCFDPTLPGNAAIPLDTNCPYATSSSSSLLGIQIAAELSSNPVINNPVNTGLTTALAHYEPPITASTTPWAPSPINSTPNPACSNTTGTDSTHLAPQACYVLDIQQSIFGDPTDSGKTGKKGTFAMIYNVPMPLSFVSVNGTAVNAPPINNNGFSAALWFKSPLSLSFVVNPACPLSPPVWPCVLTPPSAYNYFNPAPVAGESFDVTDQSGNVVYPAPPLPSPAQAVPPTLFNTESVQQITFPGTSNQVGLPDGKYFLQWSALDNVGITEQNVQLITSGTCPNPAGGTFPAPCYQTGIFQAQLNVDSTPPQITGPTLTPPPATYNGVPNAYLLNQIATGAFSCSDPLTNGVASGIASCTGPTGGIVNTSVIGNNSFTVNAADVAGNTASSSASYTVVDQPVDVDVAYLAPFSVKPGSQVAYIVGVVNEAKKNIAYGVTLTITVSLPAGASIASVTPAGGTCSVSANVITCNLAPLSPLNTFSAAGLLVVVNVPKTTTSGKISNLVSVTTFNRQLDNDAPTSFSITVKN